MDIKIFFVIFICVLFLYATRRSRKRWSKKLEGGTPHALDQSSGKTTAPSPCAAIPLPRAPGRCTRGVTDVLPVPVQYHVICYHHMNTYDHSPCSCLSYGRNIQDRKQQKDSCQKDFPSHSKLTPGLADAQTRLYGFSMMLSGESPSMLFDLGLTRFEANYNPHLIYDASCLAKEYRYNRELEGSCLSPSPPTEGYICDATCSSDASIATTFISKI